MIQFNEYSFKFPKTGGPLSNKLVRSWRAQTAPRTNGNHKSMCAGEQYTWPASLASAARTVRPVGAAIELQVQNICRSSVVLLPPLQARRYAPLMPNLQVTCMLPQHICFCGCRSCGVQAARDKTGKVYSRGILRF